MCKHDWEIIECGSCNHYQEGCVKCGKTRCNCCQIENDFYKLVSKKASEVLEKDRWDQKISTKKIVKSIFNHHPPQLSL